MSSAYSYLKSILTPEEWAEYLELANVDRTHSEARKRYWRYQHRNEPQKSTALAWLIRRGYCNEAGEWLGRCEL